MKIGRRMKAGEWGDGGEIAFRKCGKNSIFIILPKISIFWGQNDWESGFFARNGCGWW
jgi:hypothetical protein